jgi:DNA-binding response OmpR family regulator
MAQILLVEPDRLLARTYHDILTHQGHTVRICATAQGGVYCADEFRPDVVILELQLVAHSGVEFLYEFRSYPDWNDIPVIIHTNVPAGEFSGSWKLLRNHLGVTQYLYKPVTTLKKLVSTVHDFAPVAASR